MAIDNATLFIIEKFPYHVNKPNIKTNELITNPIRFIIMKYAIRIPIVMYTLTLSFLIISNGSLSVFLIFFINTIMLETKIPNEIRIGQTAGPGTPRRESGSSLPRYKVIIAININNKDMIK